MHQINETMTAEAIQKVKEWHREMRIARSKSKVKFTMCQRPMTGESKDAAMTSTSSEEGSEIEIDVDINTGKDIQNDQTSNDEPG